MADSLYPVPYNLRFLNPNNMKWCHDDVIIVFSQSVHKTCQKEPTALKLCRLIVSPKFPKICKFENHVTDEEWRHNDVVTKTMENNGKMRTSAEPNKIYIVRKALKRAIQKCNFYWILSHCVKSYGHLCQVLPWPLTKYGHVTWPWLKISNFYF